MVVIDPRYFQMHSLMYWTHILLKKVIWNFYDHPSGNTATFVLITYFLTHSLTHSPTPWSRGLPEKLTGPQLVKKLPAFNGTRRFITAFTRHGHLSLFWARLIQSMLLSHFSDIYFCIILQSVPVFSKWSLSLRFPHQNPICTLISPIRATFLAHLSRYICS